MLCAAFSIFAQTKTERIDGEQLKAIVIGAKEKKQPIIINFWATWCGPCRVEFPDLVKIEADYRSKNLNFALVSVDNLGLMDTLVAEFLRQYEAEGIPSYLLDYTTRRQLAKAIRQIAPAFSNRYPLTLLFDAKGKLVYQKAGVINPKVMRAQIDKVLPKN